MKEREVYKAILRNSIRVIDLEAENQKLKELLKECNKTFFEIRLSLASGKINSVFDLSYQRENDINEALK